MEGSFDSGRGSPGSFRRAVANADGTYSPVQVGGLDTPPFPRPDCRAGGGYPSGSLCRMDFSDQRTMIAAEQRAQLFADAEFELAGGVTLFSEIGWSVNEVKDRVGNMLLFRGNVERTNEFFVPANHPFNFWTDPDDDGVLAYVPPSDWIPGVHEAVPLGYFGRPLGAEAFGENSGDELREFDNLRLMAGFETELPGGWTGRRLYCARARTDFPWTLGTPLGGRRVCPGADRGAVESFRHAAGRAGPGHAQDRGGRRAGAGAGRQARRQRSGDRAPVRKRQDGKRQERSERGGVRGDRRPVRVARRAGDAGRRRPVSRAALLVSARPAERFRRRSAGDSRLSPGGGPARVGGFRREPDAYFGDRAELQLAARHERYDRAGNSTDPKIAAQFFATDRLSLRASWGTSFQAPSVFQAAGNTSSRTLTDPFRFDGQGVGQCTIDSSGEIVNRGDNFAVATVLRGGGLSPQTARLANFGLLLQPTGQRRRQPGLLDARLHRRHRPGTQFFRRSSTTIAATTAGPTTPGCNAIPPASSAC